VIVCVVLCTEWHLATQILYFIAAVLILVAEVLARIHICCDEERNSRNYATLGIIVLVSGNFVTRYQGLK